MSERLVYLDTSSIVKRYLEERGSEVVDKVYEEAERGRLGIAFSIWNVGETIGVLDRYHVRGLISGEELKIAVLDLISESIKLMRLDALRILPITSGALVEAWILIMRRHIYEAAALQISSARKAGCGLLLTADDRLIGAAIEEGLEAIDIEGEPERALREIGGLGEG